MTTRMLKNASQNLVCVFITWDLVKMLILLQEAWVSGSIEQEASCVLFWICQETFGPY